MKKVAERLTVDAKLTHMEALGYDDIASGRGIPIRKSFYELTFETDDKEKLSFAVSEYEYHVVSLYDKGKLVYIPHKHYNELISFADKIKEFTL